MVKNKIYDIESLPNVFTCAIYNAQDNRVEVYYILDDKDLLQTLDVRECVKKVKEVNSTILPKNTTFGFYNLKNKMYATQFTNQFINIHMENGKPFFNDTDNAYKTSEQSIMMGYNSSNYDLTMLTVYFGNSWEEDKLTGKCTFRNVVNASDMFKFNNSLFNTYKERMTDALGEDGYYKDLYWSMINTGRHIDIANLNEKQSKVGLKRLLGMLGYQIKESEKLDTGNTEPIKTKEEFYDLIAYNISDIAGTYKLFQNDIYSSNFQLKSQLLEDYPELIYDRPKKKDEYNRKEYKPEINEKNVRRGRLRIDSTSANFATKCLCPYDRLKDYKTVSFLYPSIEKCKELGIQQINVLDNLWEWYQEQFKDFPEIVENFKVNIYDYYKQIEGKNFNDGDNYRKDYGNITCYNVKTLQPIDRTYAKKVYTNGNIEYYDKNGEPTGCFASFSIGGIHGAEYNIEKYNNDLEEYNRQLDVLNKVKEQFPNPHDLRVAKKVVVDDFEYSYTAFLKSGATIKNPESCIYKEIEKPTIFVEKDKGFKLNDSYTYTSSALCDHEDFSSYYPSMLINMNAMYNKGLGYDRYAEIYGQKETFGKKMKDEQYSKDQRKIFKIMRGGTKLILNSASGAGDLGYDTPIRMNNKILSMRLIGQFFTFRMAQEQTLAGARVISTNTDGIYVVTPDKDLTRGILTELEKLIQVKIEPEEMWLVSKDTNNRVEFSADGKEVLSASGGTLACFANPSPDKALAHPAIIDNALLSWLQSHKENLSEEPSLEIIENFLKQFIAYMPVERSMLMFQNVIASSTGTDRYMTLVKNIPSNLSDIKSEDCTNLQHYNRVYYVKPEYSNEHLVCTTLKTIPKKNGKINKENNPDNEEAVKVLKDYGVKTFPNDKQATFVKIPSIDPENSIKIYNAPIINSDRPDELKTILSQLDLRVYATLIHDTFMNSWANM